jgi:membrane-bound lytic murein transglycosylase D
VTWYSYQVNPGQKLASIAHQFKVPLDALKSINPPGVSVRLSVGQVISIPIPLHMSTEEATMIAEDMLHTGPQRQIPAPGKNGSIRYRVRRGDTVWELARLFRTSAANICTWNGLSNGQRLVAGQIIVLYTGARRSRTAAPAVAARLNNAPKRAGAQSYVVQKGETLYSISRKLGVQVSSLASANGLDSVSPVIYAGEKLSYYSDARRQQAPSQPDTVLYRVCRGDNLYSLAQSFSVTVNELVQANNLSAFAPLRIGAVLRIPMGKRSS